LRPLKTLRDKTNDQTSEKPKSKPVMQTSSKNKKTAQTKGGFFF